MTKNQRCLAGGQIWRAKDVVACQQTDKKKRRVVVEKGEMVEFRYQHDAHFRTKDDMYLFLKEEEFRSNFEYVGQVFEEVRFNNRNTLAQILDGVLYNEEKQEEEE